jgi:cytochrome c2
MRSISAMLAGAVLGTLLTGCGEQVGRSEAAAETGGGDAQRGAALILQYGCGGCHVVPGIAGAQGLVGPPLTTMARRVYIAGVLRNSPENMVAWLQNPQKFVPGNAMPNMGIDNKDARDLTAFLASLR